MQNLLPHRYFSDKHGNFYIEIMEPLIPEEIVPLIEKVIADGGYYSKKIIEILYKKGISSAIPPPSHATAQGKAGTQWHDKIVQSIKEKGTIYAFHKKYGYGGKIPC